MTTAQRVGLTMFGAFMAVALVSAADKKPVDPGVRAGGVGSGGPLKGLTAAETAFFQDGRARFAEIESVIPDLRRHAPKAARARHQSAARAAHAVQEIRRL